MCHFYNGTPINEVNFEEEFDKELKILEETIKDLKIRKRMRDIKNKNYQYWTMKLNRANKALEVGQVTLN